MSYEKDQIDVSDFQSRQLPSGLNVLTILSFIGCALQLLGGIWQFYTAKKSFDEKDAMLAKLNSPEMPAYARKMIGDPQVYISTITKSYENRIPIFIISIVAAALCFYGVVLMRKLNKQGFLFYTIGELLPFVSMFFFIGAGAMAGIGFFIAAFLAGLFILMYALNLKKMVY